MIYKNFTQEELDRIISIIEPHQVDFHVSSETADPESPTKSAAKRSRAFYDITILKEEFSKLPADAVSRLERLNIYPDMSDTFLMEEEGPEKVEKPRPVKKKASAFEKFLGFAVILMLMGGTIFWIDRHLFQGHLLK